MYTSRALRWLGVQFIAKYFSGEVPDLAKRVDALHAKIADLEKQLAAGGGVSIHSPAARWQLRSSGVPAIVVKVLNIFLSTTTTN